MTDSHSLLLLVRCIAVYASSGPWNLLEAAGGMNEEPSGRFRMFRPTSVEDEKDSIVDDFLAKEDEEEEEAVTSAAPQATVEVVQAFTAIRPSHATIIVGQAVELLDTQNAEWWQIRVNRGTVDEVDGFVPSYCLSSSPSGDTETENPLAEATTEVDEL
jgi:hypothetical protein